MFPFHKALKVLLLLCIPLLYSCKKSENKNVLLTGITSTITDYNLKTNTTLTYNEHGLLSDVKVSWNNGAYLDQYSHTYGSDKKITMLTKFNDDQNRTEAFSYDLNKRLSSILVSFKETWYGSKTYTPIYDEKGRLSRILWDNKRDGGYAAVFTYDNSGNIILEEGYYLNAADELVTRFYTLEVTYDNKKNPVHGLGSLFGFGYSLPTGDPLYLSPISISHFSVNNPIKFKHTGYAGTVEPSIITKDITYEYNEQGYPSKIKYNDVVKELQYTVD